MQLRVATLYVGNHLNALIEPPAPQDICRIAQQSASRSQDTELDFVLDLAHYISNPEVNMEVEVPLLYNPSQRTSHLRFPPDLTSAGLQQYVSYYCGQLQTLILFDNCGNFVSSKYNEYLQTLTSRQERSSAPPDSSNETVNSQLFDPVTHIPFHIRAPSICSDSLWCDHTFEFQRRLHLWQNPLRPDVLGLGRPHRSCEDAKFLIFEPFTSVHGIGSIILQIAIALRFALCHGRILYLTPAKTLLQQDTHVRWMADHCKGSLLDCYFIPPSSCVLSESDILGAPYLVEGTELQYFPLKMERVVAMMGLPTTGYCTVCGSEWAGDFSFFDGLTITGNPSHENYKHLKFMSMFLGQLKLPWLAQMTRYLLRPRPWFVRQLQATIRSRLSSIGKVIPRPFASLHVRYGEKALEVDQVPLEMYMGLLARKAPHIQHIFLSTETETVIHNLTR